jgi:hypothetical protein
METTIIGTEKGEIFCGTWYKRQEIEIAKATHVRVSTQQSYSAGFFKGVVGRICRGEWRSWVILYIMCDQEKKYITKLLKITNYTVLTKMKGGKMVKLI